MNSTKSRKSAFFGWVFIGLNFYTLITVSIFAFSAISFTNKKIIDIWPINKYQQYFYFKATRNIWQFDPDCAEINDYLIYQPKIGRCNFNNTEFETTLNFDNLGRKIPNRPSKTEESGIAVIGDSFAMGWGVNDDETFSNILQSKTNKPIYNLGVSSYGTDREIRRLIESKLISKIDTIVIQYCGNDLNENEAVGDEATFNNEKNKFKTSFYSKKSTTATKKVSLIFASIGAAISEPYKAGKKLALGITTEEDFRKHQIALNKVFNRYQNELEGKKILVFYLNGYVSDYANFPDGQDSNIQNISYFDFQKNKLSKQDFFSIDGHLNSRGHKNLGEAIAEHLKLKFN